MHAFTDAVAMLIAWYGGLLWQKRYNLSQSSPLPMGLKPIYLIWVSVGLLLGSLVFGSLNLWLSGHSILGKSFLGGLVGAVFSAELFKFCYGITASTGATFIPSLLILIIVGRIGCFHAGLDDFTYGIATDLPWAVNFGDGIHRHPVQLYESLAMLLFAIYFLVRFTHNKTVWLRRGFYIFLFYYALQRFIWEFFKPYAVFIFGLNLFQLLCLGCMIFAFYKWYQEWQHEP